MLDWFFRSGGRKRVIDWLGLDARIDFGPRFGLGAGEGPLRRLLQLLRALPPDRLEARPERARLGGADARPSAGLPCSTPSPFPPSPSSTRARSPPAVRRHVRRPQRHRDRQARHPAQRRRHAGGDPRSPDQGHARHRGPPLLRALRHRRPRHASRALIENARANEVVQGGSSITQQLAKNLFLSNERSLARKIKEAFLALLLEARFTKPADPEDVPGSRLPGRRRLRGGSRLAVLLRQVRAATSTSRNRRCSPACSRRRPAMPRTSTCRPRARAPTRS